MSRFTTNTYRSLNESIARVQNPQAALDEAMEYAALLEEVLLALCEELGLDPDALLEDVQTFERESESRAERKKLEKERDAGNRKWWTAAGRKKAGIARGKITRIEKRDNKEHFSKQLYGKGGKVIRKGTAKYKRELEQSNKQRAAYQKGVQKKIKADVERFRAANSNWRELERLAGGGWGSDNVR